MSVINSKGAKLATRWIFYGVAFVSTYLGLGALFSWWLGPAVAFIAVVVAAVVGLWIFLAREFS